jgi:Cu-Zn family superoxide dismutase
MKKPALIFTLFALIAFTGCKEKKTDTEETMVEETVTEVEPVAPKSLTVILESKSESTATGKVYFEEENGMVKMEAKFMGLTPGTHAIHIHEKADCTSPDGKSAGGHWNPTMVKHGKWGDPEGYHRGDIGNMVADEEGNATITMQTEEWCIGCGDEKKDLVGKSIIVHQGVDDFVTQPTGDAGGRVSCGGIIE